MNKKFIIVGICAICLAIGIGVVVSKTKEKREIEETPYLQEEYVKNEIEKLDENLDENKKIGKEINMAR